MNPPPAGRPSPRIGAALTLLALGLALVLALAPGLVQAASGPHSGEPAPALTATPARTATSRPATRAPAATQPAASPPAPTVPPASPAATVPATAVATPAPPEGLLGLSPDSLLVLASALLVLVAIVMLAGLILWLAGQRVRAPRTAARPAAAPAREVATAATPAARPPPPAGPLIEFEGLPGGPQRFYVGGAAILGRGADSTIRIPAGWPGWESVSRRHARIVHEVAHGHTRVVIEDLGSENGLFVNGRRTGRNVLRDGWRVSLGRLTFTYRSGESRAAEPRPAESRPGGSRAGAPPGANERSRPA
jgi:hypothetical protein